MIHSNKHIIYFLAGCLSLFASCTDEEMINKEIEVEEGIPVTIPAITRTIAKLFL